MGDQGSAGSQPVAIPLFRGSSETINLNTCRCHLLCRYCGMVQGFKGFPGDTVIFFSLLPTSSPLSSGSWQESLLLETDPDRFSLESEGVAC